MRVVPEDVNVRRITLAAEMYYIYDMSQKQIAERLGVSRPWVSKLLKRAKETGIVRIDINSPLAGMPEVEQRIMNKYRINRVTVIRPMANGGIFRKSSNVMLLFPRHTRPVHCKGSSPLRSSESPQSLLPQTRLPQYVFSPPAHLSRLVFCLHR